jgi:hypothetical protein
MSSEAVGRAEAFCQHCVSRGRREAYFVLVFELSFGRLPVALAGNAQSLPWAMWVGNSFVGTSSKGGKSTITEYKTIEKDHTEGQ